MNEILTDAVTGDGYSEALTLGPFDSVEAIDVQTERADVFFQVATDPGQGGSPVWLDREYAHRPGTRHLERVNGIRFRSKQAGSSAIVNASITDDSLPLISPRIPLPASGVGDALLELSSPLAAGSSFGPFDVGDFPALLVAASAATGAAGQGIAVELDYQDVLGGSIPRELQVLKAPAAYVAGDASIGFLVVENLSRLVRVGINLSGGTNGAVYVAPCAALRQQEPVPQGPTGDMPGYLFSTNARNINAGVTQKFLVPPYRGKARLSFDATSGVGGPYRLFVQGNDFQDFATVTPDQFLFSNRGNLVPVNTALEVDIVTIPAPMVIGVVNTGGAAGTYNLDLVAIPDGFA